MIFGRIPLDHCMRLNYNVYNLSLLQTNYADDALKITGIALFEGSETVLWGKGSPKAGTRRCL